MDTHYLQPAVAEHGLRRFAEPVIRPASIPRPENSPSCQDTIAEVLTASWCCSVGATWTVELRCVNPSTTDPLDTADPLAGPVVEWFCSGVPTELPAPVEETTNLLAGHGLLLFPDKPLGCPPRTRSRQLIGHVTRNPELIRLALMLADLVEEAPVHPMVLALRWIEAGYSPEAAADRVATGLRRVHPAR